MQYAILAYNNASFPLLLLKEALNEQNEALKDSQAALKDALNE